MEQAEATATVRTSLALLEHVFAMSTVGAKTERAVLAAQTLATRVEQMVTTTALWKLKAEVPVTTAVRFLQERSERVTATTAEQALMAS